MPVDEGTTCQYYINTSGPLNPKRGVQDNVILNNQDYDNMYVINLCMTEKKNPLPEIPLIEEPAIFEQQSQNWYKCMIFDMIMKENTQEEGGSDFGEIQCSPGGYMEMLDETYKKLRLRAKESTLNLGKGSSAMATSSALKATSSASEATSSSSQATTTPVQATLPAPASRVVPPSSPILPTTAAKRTAAPAASPFDKGTATKAHYLCTPRAR
jgi:hypothetical protein